MARYSSAFKAKAVVRLLAPESAPLDVVSREIGVCADTLSRWHAEALSDSHDRLWTGPARLEAVIHTASLRE
jgi:transposase-like protein